MSDFVGHDRVVLASVDRVSTHTHRLELVEYSFEDGSTERYVEVHESWPDGQRMDRRVALTDAVHALLNLGEDELFVVGNRSPHHREIEAAGR